MPRVTLGRPPWRSWTKPNEARVALARREVLGRDTVLDVRILGEVAYEEAQTMKDLQQQRIEAIPDTLLILSHPEVVWWALAPETTASNPQPTTPPWPLTGGAD